MLSPVLLVSLWLRLLVPVLEVQFLQFSVISGTPGSRFSFFSSLPKYFSNLGSVNQLFQPCSAPETLFRNSGPFQTSRFRLVTSSNPGSFGFAFCSEGWSGLFLCRSCLWFSFDSPWNVPRCSKVSLGDIQVLNPFSPAEFLSFS